MVVLLKRDQRRTDIGRQFAVSVILPPLALLTTLHYTFLMNNVSEAVSNLPKHLCEVAEMEFKLKSICLKTHLPSTTPCAINPINLTPADKEHSEEESSCRVAFFLQPMSFKKITIPPEGFLIRKRMSESPF